jgi:hypothetical protein
VLLKESHQSLSLAMHPLDCGHALVGFVAKQVHVAHQTQPFEEEDLLLCIAFFVVEHQIAKLGGHHLREFQTPFGHVSFNLEERLRRVLHAEHDTMHDDSLRTYDAFDGLMLVGG